MLSMPQSGFQALVLCGPGIGLSTFTSIPDEYPKALVSIANRPMVWYVLDWCYRMGVTSKPALIIFKSLLQNQRKCYCESPNAFAYSFTEEPPPCELPKAPYVSFSAMIALRRFCSCVTEKCYECAVSTNCD
jgi:hypothetical protein